VNMQWPSVSEQPVNEFGETRIFFLAFPWLFPGGFGDPKDYPGDLGDWGEQMLFYEDTRFSSDKIFTFFATNYIIRHRNASSGRWFMDNFLHDSPETLEELQTKIQEGDTKFINSLTYFNKRTKGCNAFWMHKRSEVYSWINHHVEVGKGVPMFFITLSCAEYFWADVARLIKERLEIAGLDTSNCELGAKGFSQLVNDHTVVVQEFFQERVTTWLDTVGKAIFGIKHYWVRYEFTPGRGQIHAHLLAIPEDQSIYKLAHDAGNAASGSSDNNAMNRASILEKWAKEKFGLTAEVDPGFDSIQINPGNSPTKIRFTDVHDDEDSIIKDTQHLLKAVQTRKCSRFCMRVANGKGNGNK